MMEKVIPLEFEIKNYRFLWMAEFMYLGVKMIKETDVKR